MRQEVIKILLTIIFVFACSNAMGKGGIENQQGYEKLRSELLSINQADILTEWDMLILAICWKESRFYRTTNENYHGYMQISRIYVKEVNRLAKTKYTYADARDFRKSVQMHNLINKHLNPKRNLMKALRIHNPRTAYHRDALKKLEKIKEYERQRGKK